jgi:hypothetical protein
MFIVSHQGKAGQKHNITLHLFEPLVKTKTNKKSKQTPKRNMKRGSEVV